MPSYAITGASRGLGRELVRQLSADPKNTIFALVRTPAKATALTELAAQHHDRIHVLTADVTDPASLKTAAEAVGAVTGGTLDVLIHNAFERDPSANRFTPSKIPLEREAVEKLFSTPWATDVYGTLCVTNTFLPLVEKGEQKKVVHISSAMADLDLIKTAGLAMSVPPSVSKAGMNVLSAKYAAEYEGKGVKFLALSPGWVDTFEGALPPQMKAIMPMLLKQFQRAAPDLKGPMTVEEAARLELEVIAKLDDKMSGSFVGLHGDKYWF